MQSDAPYRDSVDIGRQIRNRLDRPVVMVGMMGAGKSRIGRMLADRLGVDFIDSDSEIEASAGCSVAEIFERFGESAFRSAEEKIMSRLLDGGVRVIATGGGTLMNPVIAEAVRGRGLAVWLRADLPLLLRRTAEGVERPLLKNGDPEAILRDLMQRREPVYAAAPIIVESTDVPHQATVSKVMEALYDHLR